MFIPMHIVATKLPYTKQHNVETLAIVKETEPKKLGAVNWKGDNNLERVDSDVREEDKIRQEADALTERHKEGNMQEKGSVEQIQDRMGLGLGIDWDLKNGKTRKEAEVENNIEREYIIEKESEVENAKGSMAAFGATIQSSHLATEVEEVVEVFAEDVVMELRKSELQSDDHAAVVTEVLELESRTQPQSNSSEDIEVPHLSETLSDGAEEDLLRNLRKEKGYSSDMDAIFSLAKSKKQATKVVRTSQRKLLVALPD